MPRLSIKAKLSAVISIPVLCFIVFNTWYIPRHAQRSYRSQSELWLKKAADISAHMLTPSLEGNSKDVPRIMEGLSQIPSLAFYVMFDADGRQVLASPQLPSWLKDHAKTPGIFTVTHEQVSFQVVTVPVSYRVHDLERTGALVCVFGMEDVEGVMRDSLTLGILISIAALGLAIGTTIFVSNRYVRPILQLTTAAQQVARGSFEGVTVKVRGRDELQDLSQSFEAMTHKLRTSRDEIARQNRLLEFRVQERTRQLMETIWELEEIRANLEQLVVERTKGLEHSREELKAWAETLEEKVREKTIEHQQMNESLLASFKQLQQLDRMKDEFLANMSHELRTPLNAVIGFSGLLLQESSGRIPPDVKEDLGIILQNGRSLLHMIDSILDLSKIEAGRFDLELVEMDPLPILEEVRSLAAGLILDRPIRFSYTPPPFKARVMGDPLRFKQVVTNLVGNAIKFTEHGQVDLFVAKDARAFRVSIRDTGIGMSLDEVSRLFVPFQQVDGGITRRFGGTGLGLALSKRLTHMMKGELIVQSEKGVGSTFTIELPLVSEG